MSEKDLILNFHQGPDDGDDEMAEVIEEGTKLLELDAITPQGFIPRNGLVTVKRLGSLKDNRAGNIVLPSTMVNFDVAEVLCVGRGTPGESQVAVDTSDLQPGMKVLIKTGMDAPPGRPPSKNTLTFRIGDQEVELLNQSDILVIINTKETTNEQA